MASRKLPGVPTKSVAWKALLWGSAEWRKPVDLHHLKRRCRPLLLQATWSTLGRPVAQGAIRVAQI
eukprot:9486995-Pyramimonas_sp.AAC.1